MPATSWQEIRGNKIVEDRLLQVLKSGRALAYLGAGVSADIYPLWNELLERLVKETVARRGYDRLTIEQAMEGQDPHQKAQVLRDHLGPEYFPAIDEIFRPPTQGQAYTRLHAAAMRLPVKGFVTTNIDTGLLAAARALKIETDECVGYEDNMPENSQESWRWASGDVFDNPSVVPILFAHGRHDVPRSIVLTQQDYSNCYKPGNALTDVTASLFKFFRLVLIGVGFDDYWMKVLAQQATRPLQGTKTLTRHIAIVGVDAAKLAAPTCDDFLRKERDRFLRTYRADVLFYPILSGADKRPDHSQLRSIVRSFTRPAPRAKEWLNTVNVITAGLLQAQSTVDGGFRWLPAKLSSETHPWATSQAMVAIASRPEILSRAYDSLVGAFRYLNTQGAPVDWSAEKSSRESRLLVDVKSWSIIAVSRLLAAGRSIDAVPQGVKDDLLAFLVKNLTDLIAVKSGDSHDGTPGSQANSWCPLAFREPQHSRTYSTLMAVWALSEFLAAHGSDAPETLRNDGKDALNGGVRWLVMKYRTGHGWIPNPSRYDAADYPGLSAQCFFVLESAIEHVESSLATSCKQILEDIGWLHKVVDDPFHETDTTNQIDASFDPYGVNMIEPTTYQWFPWTLAAASRVAVDTRLSQSAHDDAADIRSRLLSRYDEFVRHLQPNEPPTYELSEYVIGVSYALNSLP